MAPVVQAMNAAALARLRQLEEALGRRPGRDMEARVAAARQRLIDAVNVMRDLPLAEISAGRAAVRAAIDRARAR